MPRLRHVLDPRLASVTDQNEGQSISVWAAELIHTVSSAIFGDRPCTAGLLNCDRIACDRKVAPDFRLWLSSHDMKCTVGIKCPDGAERVCPRPCESGWTGRCRRARTD